MKKIFTPQQKAAVALEALKGEKSVAEISSIYEVHSTQIKNWKNVLKEQAVDLFADKRTKEGKTQERLVEELYRLLGRREAEVAWLKKNCNLNYPQKVSLIDAGNTALSIVQQSSLLDISRSSVYYEPEINSENIRIMHAIDAIFTECPFYGSRKICFTLGSLHGIHICREHVQHLMRLMGLIAIYPKQKPPTSTPDALQRKYPYLLRNLPITRPNQVWGTDITYVRLEKGFCYLLAIIDWYSRYVICWQLSETLDIDFCIENLQRALTLSIPDMHNSDQGSHFTSGRYTSILSEKNIQISMDGRGRCMDNIFTERLWRTVKYENIFLSSYANSKEARAGLEIYFPFYNTRRPHQSLGYRTPSDLYFPKQIFAKEEKTTSVNALYATMRT